MEVMAQRVAVVHEVSAAVLLLISAVLPAVVALPVERVAVASPGRRRGLRSIGGD